METEIKKNSFLKKFLINRAINGPTTIMFLYLTHHTGNYLLTIKIMSVTSLIAFYIGIKLYDYFKDDWFSIEAFKKAKFENLELDEKDNSLATKKITKLLKMGGKVSGKVLLLLVLLSWDPSIFVIYFRKGFYLYDGMKGWKIKIYFLMSVIMSTIALTPSAFLLNTLINFLRSLF
ncbi:MAG: hypothetical protein WCO35_00340 [Candidatus Nomurabacteria bacterium]